MGCAPWSAENTPIEPALAHTSEGIVEVFHIHAESRHQNCAYHRH